MVTRQKARARKLLSNISGCTEFTNAYMFFNSRSENAIGGFDMPVFVIKESGELMTTLFYYTTMSGEEIRTVTF